MTETAGIIYVDDQPYPVDFLEVTGEDVLALRQDLGIEMGRLYAISSGGPAGLPELVAFMVLSLRQSDEPADARWLLRHTRLNADVRVDGFAAVPVPA